MVDVWPGRQFPDFARLDWWISIALYIVAYVCLFVGVVTIACVMFVLGVVFAFGLNLPVYLVESDCEICDPKLVNGLDILRSRVFYCFSDIMISGPYWGKELELLRMDHAETESRVGKSSVEVGA